MATVIALLGSCQLGVQAEVRNLGDFVICHPEYLGLVADILIECKETSHFQDYLADNSSALAVLRNRNHRDSLIDLLRCIYHGTQAEVDYNRSRVAEYLASKAIPFRDGLQCQDKRYHARLVWAESGEPVVERDEHDLDVATTGTDNEVSACEGFECKVNLASIFYLAEERLRTPDARKVNYMVQLEKALTAAGLKVEIGFVMFNKSVARYASFLQAAGAQRLTLRGPADLHQRLVRLNG